MWTLHEIPLGGYIESDLEKIVLELAQAHRVNLSSFLVSTLDQQGRAFEISNTQFYAAVLLDDETSGIFFLIRLIFKSYVYCTYRPKLMMCLF